MNYRSKLRLCVTLLMLCCIVFTAVIPVSAATYPKPSDKVADEAGVLSENTIRSIKNTNEKLTKDVGAAVAVCTVKTTGDTNIADYASAVFKEWKLGEGVLILIANDDNNYYFVQSVGVEKIITNEVLANVRDTCLEEDFAAGNIDRGVFKAVTRLSSLLVSALEDAVADENTENQGATSTDKSEKGTTFGSVLVGFFKFVLWVALILIILFVALFVAALFNDDAASIFSFVWQNLILRKRNNKAYSMPGDYYDERLYGNGNRGNAQRNAQQRRNPDQHRPNSNRRPPQNHGALPSPSNGANGANGNRGNYPQNRQMNQNRQPQNRPSNGQTYYNADGTVRRPRQNPNSQYNHNVNNQNQNTQFGDETRQFIIPGREQNRR